MTHCKCNNELFWPNQIILWIWLLCSLGGKMQSIALTYVDDNFFAFTLNLFYRELKEFFSEVLN